MSIVFIPKMRLNILTGIKPALASAHRVDIVLGRLKTIGFSPQQVAHYKNRLIAVDPNIGSHLDNANKFVSAAQNLEQAGLNRDQNAGVLDRMFEINLFSGIAEICASLKAAGFQSIDIFQFLTKLMDSSSTRLPSPEIISAMHGTGFQPIDIIQCSTTLMDSGYTEWPSPGIISCMREQAFTRKETLRVSIREAQKGFTSDDLEKMIIALKARKLSNPQALEVVDAAQARRLSDGIGNSRPYNWLGLCVGAFDTNLPDAFAYHDYEKEADSPYLSAGDFTKLFKLLFTKQIKSDGWDYNKICRNCRYLLNYGLTKEQLYEMLENIPDFQRLFNDDWDCAKFTDCLSQLSGDINLCCQVLNAKEMTVDHLAAFCRLVSLYSSIEKASETWQTLKSSVKKTKSRSFAPELLEAGFSLEATRNVLNFTTDEMFEHLPHFLRLGCNEKDLKETALNWKIIKKLFIYARTKQELLALMSSLSFWKNNLSIFSGLEQLISKNTKDNIGLSLKQIGQLIIEVILAKKLSYALILFEAFTFSAVKNERYQVLRAFIMKQEYDLKTRINIWADYCELLALEENVTLQSKEELLELVKQTAARLNATIKRILRLAPTQKAQILKLRKRNSSILKTLRRKLVSIALGRPLNRREIKLFAHPQTLGKILNLVRLVYSIKGGSGFGQGALCEQLLANLLTVLLLNYAPAQEQAEQKAVTAMNKWLFNLDKNAIRKMGEEDLPIQGNFEIRERLVAAGFNSKLWEEGIDIPISNGQPLTEEGKKNQIRSAAFELVEIALIIGLTHFDGQPLTLAKAAELDSHEKASTFVEHIKNSGLKITAELLNRANYILQTILELEKQKVQQEAEQARFRVTIKKDLFTEAFAGAGVPGCFNPRGIHREMPFVHGSEVNSGFIQVFNDKGIQVANAVIVYEEQGAYVYPGYNGTAYDMDKIFAQALIELSQLVPAILLDSTSAGFNTLQRFATRKRKSFRKPATIFSQQYFDAGTIDLEDGTLTLKKEFHVITEESIRAQGGFDQPAIVTAEKDDKFPSINWQALANMFLQEQALRPFLAIIGNVRQKVQTEGQLVINDDFYAFISRAILKKVGQTDPDLEIEIADLVLDFLESQSWPMDIQTAV